MASWRGVNPADWAQETQDEMLAVFRQSVVLLAREMTRTRDDGGVAPKITGNLVRSILAQVNQRVQVSSAEDFAGSDVGAAVAQALLGDTVYLGFQAAYARRVNSGFVGEDAMGRTFNQQGAGFVERAINLWPQIVDQATREVRDGVGV